MRILIAAVFYGLAVLNLMWFAGALRTTLADAGQDGWGAAATASQCRPRSDFPFAHCRGRSPRVLVPITTSQILERLGCFKNDLRPFTAVTVPFPKKETDLLWTGFFIMPYTAKLGDLDGRPMVNVVSGGTFYIYDKSSSTSYKPSGWLSLKMMEDEINHILSRAESKFCTPNGSICTSKTIGLLVRRQSWQVAFITSAKRHLHAGRAGPICP